ncbi:MAG: histidinol-phosphate transaminase [Chloroflexi bacterium]|nr:histidinol-phosphate transaminase [Chloroflexota bacterium]
MREQTGGLHGKDGFDLDRALRPALRGMRGYQPIEPPEQLAARYGLAAEAIVKLDGNENPYGPSPRALAALAALPAPATLRGSLAAHRYPDPEQRRLRAALARRHQVPAECIVAGAGADELIDLVFRVFVEPGDRVVVASPTFGMYAFDARLSGAELVDVPRDEHDWSLDGAALIEAASTAKVVFIPSPNNPTGGLLLPELCERLLASGALLVVDEAYIEFSHGESLAGRAAAGDVPLIALRTFSKWAGLAGLRLGYGVMPASIAATFMQCKQPYGVNVAAEAAALASLEDSALLDERACAIAGERDRLAGLLGAGGWLEPAPSEGNFLLCRLSGRLSGKLADGLVSDATAGDGTVSGAALREALARRGVFVRVFDDPRLSSHVRISIGTPEDSERLLAALSEAREELDSPDQPEETAR